MMVLKLHRNYATHFGGGGRYAQFKVLLQKWLPVKAFASKKISEILKQSRKIKD